jgi:hypothetical protein
MKTLILMPVILVSAALIAQPALQKDKEISLMMGATSTLIHNPNIYDDKNLTINNKNGADFSLEYSKYLYDRIGLGVGIGYSTYDQVYYQRGLFKQPDQIDADGKYHEKWIDSDIRYSNRLMYLNVPVTIHLLIGNSARCYGFIDAGIINHFLVSGTHTKAGSLEYMAKYPSETGHPDWHGLTYENSYYGLRTNEIDEKDSKRFETYALSGHLAAGLVAAMTEKLSLKVAPFVNAGLTDIVGKDRGNEYENVYGEKSSYKKTKLYSAGISVGFAYDIY